MTQNRGFVGPYSSQPPYQKEEKHKRLLWWKILWTLLPTVLSPVFRAVFFLCVWKNGEKRVVLQIYQNKWCHIHSNRKTQTLFFWYISWLGLTEAVMFQTRFLQKWFAVLSLPDCRGLFVANKNHTKAMRKATSSWQTNRRNLRTAPLPRASKTNLSNETSCWKEK